MANISNRDDIIDSRDVIDRLDELRELEDELSSDEIRELAALEELNADGEDYAGDWEHGVPMVRQSHFAEYAQDLAECLGLLENANNWPLTCFDWERAARELQYDYTAIDFDGVTYYVR